MGHNLDNSANVVETTGEVNNQLSLHEALLDPLWVATMQEEFDSLIKNLPGNSFISLQARRLLAPNGCSEPNLNLILLALV
jgi:hypothetical protein